MIVVRPVPLLTRLVDRCLSPVMFLLGGCRRDCVQETHFWHGQAVDEGEIEPGLSVLVAGDEESRVTNNRLLPFPLFHAPVFGGWRRYVVLEVAAGIPYWHVGWIHRRWPAGSRPRCHVQRLKLTERQVRVLKHPRGYLTRFFAVGPTGEQVRVVCAGEGVLGDSKCDRARLC